jgi:NADH-ubiquinone oxidoreductase chain 3
LLSIIYTLSLFIKIKIQKQREKRSIFECGFDPFHKIRFAFSLRFFLLTVLFLVFDVEITVILPIPVRRRSLDALMLLNINLLIFLLLLLGLFFE